MVKSTGPEMVLVGLGALMLMPGAVLSMV